MSAHGRQWRRPRPVALCWAETEDIRLQRHPARVLRPLPAQARRITRRNVFELRSNGCAESDDHPCGPCA